MPHRSGIGGNVTRNFPLITLLFYARKPSVTCNLLPKITAVSNLANAQCNRVQFNFAKIHCLLILYMYFDRIDCTVVQVDWSASCLRFWVGFVGTNLLLKCALYFGITIKTSIKKLPCLLYFEMFIHQTVNLWWLWSLNMACALKKRASCIWITCSVRLLAVLWWPGHQIK